MFKAFRRRSPLSSDISFCLFLKQKNSKKWAKLKEVKSMGLLEESSATACGIGAYADRSHPLKTLRYAGDGHILAFAPYHSGGGLNLALSSLSDGWQESVVVHDMYGSLYDATAGYRQKIGNRVLKFNPSSTSNNPHCCHFNPLEEVRLGTDFEMADVQTIAAVLADPYDEGISADDLSKRLSFSLFTAIILHVLYAEKDKTLHGVTTFLMAMPTLEAAFEAMLSGNQSEKVHPFIEQVAQEIGCRSDVDKSLILSRSINLLEPYADPVVSEWTACSDFRITDLQDSENPITLFLNWSTAECAPWGSNAKEGASSLILLLMRLLASRLTAPDRLSEQNGVMVSTGKHPLLLLMNDAMQMGKMDLLMDNLTALPQYRIKLYMIVQDKRQLENKFHGYNPSRLQAILKNCTVKIIYPPVDSHTADWVSEQLGDGILSPDDMLCMQDCICGDDGTILSGDMIVLVDKHKPIWGKQILSIHNPVLLKRAKYLFIS